MTLTRVNTNGITDGTIVDADVSGSAAIAGTKVSPSFGSQNTTTTGTSTAASFIPTGSSVPANGVYLPGANALGLSTNSTERIRVTSGGLVGIGTTVSSPSALLDVGSGDNSTAIAFAGWGAARWSGSVLQWGGINASQWTAATFYTSGVERVRIDGSGNVGVGEASPTNSAGFSRQVEVAGTFPCVTLNQTNSSFALRKYSLGVDSIGGIGIWDNNNNAYRFYVDNSGRLLVGSSTAISGGGALQLNAGITFPATQVSSNDPNTLDDYEEGTWTPSLGGTTTYGAREARYTRIGRVVHVSFYITISGIGTGNTTTISGLPFTPLTDTGGSSLSYWNATATGVCTLVGYIYGSATGIYLYSNAGASVGLNSYPIMANGTTVQAHLSYFAA